MREEEEERREEGVRRLRGKSGKKGEMKLPRRLLGRAGEEWEHWYQV